MSGEQKAVLFTVGLIVFCFTLIAVLLFYALWPQRQLVAWILLVVGCLLALVLVFVPAASKANEMTLRRKRFHHHRETPLDSYGYPTHLPAGARPYHAVPYHETRDFSSEYNQEVHDYDR